MQIENETHAALTDLESTLVDVRAAAKMLVAFAESDSDEAEVLAYIGRQLYGWEEKMRAAFDTVHDAMCGAAVEPEEAA